MIIIQCAGIWKCPTCWSQLIHIIDHMVAPLFWQQVLRPFAAGIPSELFALAFAPSWLRMVCAFKPANVLRLHGCQCSAPPSSWLQMFCAFIVISSAPSWLQMFCAVMAASVMRPHGCQCSAPSWLQMFCAFNSYQFGAFAAASVLRRYGGKRPGAFMVVCVAPSSALCAFLAANIMRLFGCKY